MTTITIDDIQCQCQTNKCIEETCPCYQSLQQCSNECTCIQCQNKKQKVRNSEKKEKEKAPQLLTETKQKQKQEKLKKHIHEVLQKQPLDQLVQFFLQDLETLDISSNLNIQENAFDQLKKSKQCKEILNKALQFITELYTE